MFRRLMTAAAALAVVAAPQGAWAWGSTGHRLIGVAATRALPAEIPAFLRTTEASTMIGELSREPDRWKGAGRVHDDDRSGAHFIDLDDAGRAVGGPALASLPETLMGYRTAVRAVGKDENDAGWLPYSIIDGWQQLRLDFAYWRVLTAAEARATDPGRRAWYAQDRQLREMLLMRDLGVLSHYVGDGSQPLHLSIHYNGWGAYPNPRQFSNARTTHANFEGAFTGGCARLPAVQAAMAPLAASTEPIERQVPAYLRIGYEQVVPLYELEQQGRFATQTPQGCAFVIARLGSGASELRDLVVDAWRAAATAEVGWRPVKVADVEAGTVEPYDALYGVE